MKVLRLSFKNLNSLAGVWSIDFTHPDYVSSGIFAITGPTGAGKTTILDAICLALYGQTPRLSRITQGENEIMSRQTGECFSEVEFETAKGRFRCHWSQHRSRRQADGQLQSPRHEIAVVESGQILESKLRAVAEKVEEVTGMDFDRFTRSMLLAQGGFAAFLQARPDERAPILEQITGTAIYSQISIKVHERTSEERKQLGELRAELEGIRLLTPEEEQDLLCKKTDLLLAEQALTTEARIIREAQAWRERIAALEAELRQLDQYRSDFETRKTAAAPELERLELAGRALNLEGEHAHILSLRVQQTAEQGELKDAEERLPQLRIDWQSAFDALQLAESGLTRARVEQEQEAELIRITRALDVKLGEAQAQLQGLTVEIEKTQRQNGDFRRAITECDLRRNEIGAELQQAAAFLDAHQNDAGLAEALTGIEQQLKGLKTLDAQRRDTLAKLGQQSTVIETAQLTLGRTETAWQGAQQAVNAAQQQQTDLRTVRETILQNRDLSAWRTDAEAVTTRQTRLGMIQETVARIAEAQPGLLELKLRGEGLGERRQALVRQEEMLAREYELCEQVAKKMQDNVLLLNRVRSLEEDRKQLVDGAPCPLCGAADHPYASGNIPQPDEARQELELALNEAKRVQEELSRIRQDLVAVAKDLQRNAEDQAALQERLLRDEALCAGAFAELGIRADPETRPEVIRRESETCREELAIRHDIIRTGELNEQEERTLQTAMTRLRDELATHDKARLAARLGQEAALRERTRLEGESASLHDDLEQALTLVGGVVAPYGCGEVAPDTADKLLAALTTRRNAFVQRFQAGERLEKALADTTAEQEKQRALLAGSHKTLEERELLLREKGAQRDLLVEQRLERYGERNPDTEEKRLADALRQAGERREAALREQNRLRAELDGLSRLVERLSDATTRRGEQLAEREAAFRLCLADAVFADEAAFQEARLPRERFDELRHKAETLRSEEIAIQARHQDRSQALAGERDRQLTDKALDLIQEENAAVSGRLNELQKELGAIDQQLRQHAEQQQRHQSRLQAIAIQRRECDRWEQLHSLIGSSDGKRFRNFAQGLTFELMVAHANRQLQKMSDRYILLRDNSEPLELNVIDNYQAGEIRSTKNLSGGESFIASLALSLGLSSMASRNVRVDSLFLDEGFGTLDEDALETALETLSGLQQDGKLIGIISHVPALKERIGTQIQVEAGSAGRSRISGPGVNRL
ncbi:MAG: AAA family ATPase [Desulfuromonadales bacterium]|nr:AAA family ATPase [Desulfuromonadales bacterium]